MSEKTERHGRCLCGAVSVSLPATSTTVGACHCDMCRRWSGGPFLEIPGDPDTQFVGGDAIRVFNSSEWAERGFCSICGTHLFYRLKATGQHFIPVGLFDDTDGLEFAQEVFVDEQPHYYRFANDTKRLTGAELFALISGEET